MYSVSMSLVDFIPVFLFGAAAWLMQRDLYNKMSKGAYSLLCAGTMDVFMGGFLKALYKLLYAVEICDFEVLSTLFFPLQSIGLVLTGTALVCLLVRPQGKGRVYGVTAAPILFIGTFFFVTLMVLGLGGMAASLSIIAVKMKKPKLIILFAVNFLFSIAMGYLSSMDFTQMSMHWIAEGVNTIGQLALFLGVYLLSKAGLKDYQLEA